MNKYVWAALMVAGLALAGCGGSSHDHDEEEKTTGATTNGTTTSTVKTLTLPNNLTINGLFTSRQPTSYTISPGQKRDLSATQANRIVTFTCPEEGAACVITIPVDGNAGTITYDGGKPEITEKGDPAVAMNVGTSEQPTVSTDPLSNDVLLKALKTGTRVAADKTVWNSGSGGGTALPAQGAVAMFTPLNGPTINLWIRGDTGAYFGHWAESTISVNDQEFGKRGQVWGGSTPYGKKPEDSLGLAAASGTLGGDDYKAAGTARYSDGNTDALLYYSTTGKADSWTEGEGDLTLTANFKTGMVDGSIDVTRITKLDTLGRVGGNNVVTGGNNITLSPTSIGGDGKFSGSAKFTNSAVTSQSGSWKGGFFGPTTEVKNGVESHIEPSDVAGEFRVSRSAIGSGMTARQTQLHIRGAFGNDMD